jgi:hypothetical protein
MFLGAPGTATPKKDGTDLGAGFGGEIYFPGVLNNMLGLRLEWERFDIDKTDVDFLSASLLFRFGNKPNQ